MSENYTLKQVEAAIEVLEAKKIAGDIMYRKSRAYYEPPPNFDGYLKSKQEISLSIHMENGVISEALDELRAKKEELSK